MKVVSLLGFVDYEGQDLLGVFGSVEQCLQWVEERRRKMRESRDYRSESLGFHDLGYVESELGQEIDVLGEVVYL